MSATRVTVALDWTPNANHVGLYVAKAKGWYSEAGLDVQLVTPDPDYSATPASKVASGEADFAVTPSETVISYATQPQGSAKPKIKAVISYAKQLQDGAEPRIKAVAALLQSDPSAIVTLAKSGLTRPKDLDGKVYASYGARYEGRIVQQMIKADGGSGEYDECALPMLGIWNTLLEVRLLSDGIYQGSSSQPLSTTLLFEPSQGKADATWVFTNVEGVAAKRQGVDLNVFHLGDFGIPYGYSPVLAAAETYLQVQPATAKAFLQATARGYEHAAANPADAAQLLTDTANAENPELKERLEADFVAESVAATVPHLTAGSGGSWGRMDAARWNDFLDWLSIQGLLTSKVQSRAAPAGSTASLDELRAGSAGDPIPRDAVSAEQLFTNEIFLQQ